MEITYAAAQDNDRRASDAFVTRCWPTLVLIDERGYIRDRRIGEGAYREAEASIQALLAEDEPAG